MLTEARRDKFRQAGSLTLACCLMLPAIMLLMMALLVGSSRTREDLDAVRAARQSADSALASFDRELYRDFGLFALSEKDVQQTASDYLLPDTYEQRFELDNSLYHNEHLMDAIARHMSVRATAGLIDEGIQRIKSIQGIVPDNMLDSLAPLKNIDPDTADPELQEDESNEEWFSDYSDYLGEEYLDDYHDSLLDLSPVYIPASDGGVQLEFNPYKVSNLEKLAQGLDSLMFTLPEGFTDQFLLVEYSLSYFGSQVNSLEQNGSTIHYRTPDGRLQGDFSESRQYEQEMIATGAEGEEAAKNVQYFLVGSRLLIHLLANLLSTSERAKYDTSAAAISAVVAAISLGTVAIPPEAIAVILLIVDSVRGGIKDKNSLLAGEEIKLWPVAGAEAFKVNYRDHLRLLMLVQSREELLDRIGSAIRQNQGDDYFTQVSCEVTRAASGGSFPRQAFDVTIERSYFTRHDDEEDYSG